MALLESENTNLQKANKAVRFVPLIRVSTEQQQRKGESLQTQKKIISQCVEQLKGIIPDYCWKYSGQEHATEGYERKMLDELLKDSAKGLFDAVIVCDASRWSRDNKKSKENLEILKRNGIRFYVGTMEYNLYSPEQTMFLGLSTEINEFHAKSQTYKSMLSKIERANRGVPCTGKLPYARTYDKPTGKWGIDKTKQKNIEWAAEQYLDGKGLPKLAKTLCMNASNLWKILTKLSGDVWIVKFHSKKLNINETVTIQIPELLPKEQIEDILKRAASNKTYTHGQLKHQYLLGRMVFCAECGYALSGQMNHGNRRYYRHPKKRTKKCINETLWVRADSLEQAVVANVFTTFGDVSAIAKAIERAFPDMDEIRQLMEQLPMLESELAKNKEKRNRLIEKTLNGTFTDEQAKDKMKELTEMEQSQLNSIADIKRKVDSLPTKQRIRRDAHSVADRVRKWCIKETFTKREHFITMSYDAKRDLLQHAFAGNDDEGNRLGVYVQKNSEGNYTFSVKGILSIGDNHNLPLDADCEGLIEDDSFDPERDLEPEDFVREETIFASSSPAQALL